MSDAPPSETPEQNQQSPFPRTTDSVWEKVQSAKGGDAEALGKLCVIYHGPILACVSRRKPDHHEAEDLANGFIEFLLEKNRLENFVRGEVKFRSFLLKCLKGFLRDEWRKLTAAKRGGGEAPVPIDELQLGREEEIDKALDRQFALTVHRRAMEQLEAEQAKKSDSARFGELRQFVLGTDGTVSYGEIGAPHRSSWIRAVTKRRTPEIGRAHV